MKTRICQYLVLLLAVAIGAVLAWPPPMPARHAGPASGELVVLLHGLARTSRSMETMQAALLDAGYATCNIHYPSTRHTVQALARDHVLPALQACGPERYRRVHAVSHSMGGILLRYLADQGAGPAWSRVVMLAPPNQGSELVDKLSAWPPFRWINGPAGAQLSTDPDSLPNRLGPVRGMHLGVIAGDAPVNPIYAYLITGADDGKVPVAATRVAGMADFTVLPVSHSFMMNDAAVIARTVHFLLRGAFP